MCKRLALGNSICLRLPYFHVAMRLYFCLGEQTEHTYLHFYVVLLPALLHLFLELLQGKRGRECGKWTKGHNKTLLPRASCFHIYQSNSSIDMTAFIEVQSVFLSCLGYSGVHLGGGRQDTISHNLPTSLNIWLNRISAEGCSSLAVTATQCSSVRSAVSETGQWQELTKALVCYYSLVC